MKAEAFATIIEGAGLGKPLVDFGRMRGGGPCDIDFGRVRAGGNGGVTHVDAT